MEIKITGLNETLASFGKIKDQLPYAVSLAVNRTAQSVKAAEQSEMGKVFDRPTPYIMRSIAIDRARKDKLYAVIGLAIPGHGIGANAPAALRPEVAGGERKIKGAEAHLRAAGILPADKFLAPARSAELDMYGNIPGYMYVKILSDCMAFQEGSFARPTRMNRSAQSSLSKTRQYYVRTINGINIGIYKRIGSLGSGRKWSTVSDIPILNFVSRPHYKQRFDFHAVAKQTVEDVFKKNMIEAVMDAILTARPYSGVNY